MRLIARFASLALVLLLAACSASDKAYVEKPVEELYNTAMDQLVQGNFKTAAKGFDEVERQHPYSAWATKAQLMAAFANYQISQYDEAILAAERFIQLHSGNKDASYAYYLVALSYYEQIADVGRDQKVTERALNSLQEVIKRYPGSEYARDARLKVDLTRDHLAGKEMEIGRYYLRQKQYLASINRFRQVVEKYQTTTHVAEALHRLTECYLALGVKEEAQAAGAVLGHNYPGSTWYRDSYALLTGQGLSPDGGGQRSWIARAFGNIF